MYQAIQYDKGTIYLSKHKNTIQELREKWPEEVFFQKIHWEKMQDEMKELNKFKSTQKDKEQMLPLTQELLSCRAPYLSYPIFIFEQMTLFKIKDLKEGGSWKIVTPSQFLETFTQSNFF